MAVDVVVDPASDLLELTGTGQDLDHAAREVFEQRRRVGKSEGGGRLLAEEVIGVETWPKSTGGGAIEGVVVGRDVECGAHGALRIELRIRPPSGGGITQPCDPGFCRWAELPCG